jgi:hypothetical protein
MGTRATGEPGDAAAAGPQDQSATIRNEMAARRASVPLSSRPISHEHPATSAETMAASQRCSAIRANQSQTVAQGSHSRIVQPRRRSR